MKGRKKIDREEPNEMVSIVNMKMKGWKRESTHSSLFSPFSRLSSRNDHHGHAESHELEGSTKKKRETPRIPHIGDTQHQP